jgi:hypothetical protein
MKEMDFASLKDFEIIQLNKFSILHDAAKIIFCKTDFLLNEFKYIESLKNEVILISGNSDYPITNDLVNLIPKNIKFWYAQNVLTYHDKIKPIPMGIENKNESIRPGHGVGYSERVQLKENLLSRDFYIKPSKKIYSNFQVSTNFFHRQQVKEISKNCEFIDWRDPNLSLENFFNEILEYEMVICPAGNGVDTHRIWEVLYSKRIPITIKVGNFKIYELYSKLPIIILDKIDDLKNFDLINEKYDSIKKTQSNLNMIDMNYWINKIKNEINQ